MTSTTFSQRTASIPNKENQRTNTKGGPLIMQFVNQYMKCKGYEGTIEYTLEDGVLFGKVQGIKSLISYEGNTIPELEKDFHKSIDAYLDSCKCHGDTPEKPFKGKFNVRISPNLHRKLANYAAAKHQSLNASVEEAIKKLLA